MMMAERADRGSIASSSASTTGQRTPIEARQEFVRRKSQRNAFASMLSEIKPESPAGPVEIDENPGSLRGTPEKKPSRKSLVQSSASDRPLSESLLKLKLATGETRSPASSTGSPRLSLNAAVVQELKAKLEGEQKVDAPFLETTATTTTPTPEEESERLEQLWATTKEEMELTHQVAEGVDDPEHRGTWLYNKYGGSMKSSWVILDDPKLEAAFQAGQRVFDITIDGIDYLLDLKMKKMMGPKGWRPLTRRVPLTKKRSQSFWKNVSAVFVPSANASSAESSRSASPVSGEGVDPKDALLEKSKKEIQDLRRQLSEQKRSANEQIQQLLGSKDKLVSAALQREESARLAKTETDAMVNELQRKLQEQEQAMEKLRAEVAKAELEVQKGNEKAEKLQQLLDIQEEMAAKPGWRSVRGMFSGKSSESGEKEENRLSRPQLEALQSSAEEANALRAQLAEKAEAFEQLLACTAEKDKIIEALVATTSKTLNEFTHRSVSSAQHLLAKILSFLTFGLIGGDSRPRASRCIENFERSKAKLSEEEKPNEK